MPRRLRLRGIWLGKVRLRNLMRHNVRLRKRTNLKHQIRPRNLRPRKRRNRNNNVRRRKLRPPLIYHLASEIITQEISKNYAMILGKAKWVYTTMERERGALLFLILLKIPLFASLDEAELARLFAELKITEIRFERGELLAMQDELCNRLIILLAGSVRAEMIRPSGEVLKVEEIAAPSPLAILFLFGEENRFPVQVTTQEAGEAVVIPRGEVVRMLSMNERLLKNYLNISADFATRLSRKLNIMSLRTIRQKLAVWLLEQAKRQSSDTVRLAMSKTALADYFGVARPSLERELTAMQCDGLIVADKREITLFNRNALVAITM